MRFEDLGRDPKVGDFVRDRRVNPEFIVGRVIRTGGISAHVEWAGGVVWRHFGDLELADAVTVLGSLERE